MKVRYHCTPTRRAILKKTDDNQCGEHVDKLKPAHAAAATLENNLAVLPRPSHSILETVRRNESTRLHKDLYEMFTAAKFITAQKHKQL